MPLGTILGTLAGSAVISLVLKDRSLTDCLAVGSGFGHPLDLVRKARDAETPGREET